VIFSRFQRFLIDTGKPVVRYDFFLWTGMYSFSLPVNLFDKKNNSSAQKIAVSGPARSPRLGKTMTCGWVMNDRYFRETAGLMVMGKSVTG
jgi:hypothetical protein